MAFEVVEFALLVFGYFETGNLKQVNLISRFGLCWI